MSLFQCTKCGCLENTACTSCYMGTYMMNSDWKEPKLRKEHREALASYKKILGLKPEEPFGIYCSACCPMWFNDKGGFGIGPNPNPKPGKPERGGGGGLWHGEWTRMFLPKGKFETAPNGNLRHIETKDEEVRKYALPKEEGT